MIAESLLAWSLVMSASLDLNSHTATGGSALAPPSVRQKDATLLPLVRSATDCIVRKVTADPRYHDGLRREEVNDLIAESMTACSGRVRAMIDAHDSMYGRGSGEAFFMGPYLDVLPSAVVHQVKAPTR